MDIDKLSTHELKALLKNIDSLEKSDKIVAFDPHVPGSRPNPKQKQLLDDIGKFQYRIARAGNQSGKSTMCARELSWVITETHPKWQRPEKWGLGPLMAIVAGQSRSLMEQELWQNKLLTYMEPGDWKEVRTGNALSYVEHKLTKNRIIFLSHSDGSDKARRLMQGYVAHYVWMDEMPVSFKIFEELQQRITAREGYMVCSFTPKVRNEELKRHVDHLCTTPQAALYRLSKLDNPVFADRKQALLAELEGMPEGYRNTILDGEWYSGDSAVYQWDPTMMSEIPDHYSRTGWRHVSAVDPAIKSKMGALMFAEDPQTGVWYLIDDAYIEGVFHPDDIFTEARKREQGKFIVRRISDVASWFTEIAARQGSSYLSPFNKTQRKEELIKNLQAALSRGEIKIAPHCTNFIDEITGCQWSENSDRIVGGQKYHCLDSAQYFVDLKPPREKGMITTTWEADLRAANEKRKATKRAATQAQKVSSRARSIGGWGRGQFNGGR